MVPKPIGDNAQKQRLTIALKNICRDYPAGGGVLRELLQNADDAGATVVRFHLDERTHPSNELIHPALAKYQGPALLAYNDAIFTPKDFQSLSRLGDSLKIQDGLTTGKFGRGFNSVYNWTDSPVIVSLERLLILDPHEEWSPGGPVYDFVGGAKDHAIQNHMAAFQSVMEHPNQPFQGTIIRIPLRTREQAMRSDISRRETSVLEIREVLEKFATEFGNSGLLFLRNIEEVTLDSTAGISISIAMLDRENVRRHRSMVNHAVKLAFEKQDHTFDHSFEVKIESRSGQLSKKTCFVVHHTIRGNSMNSHMQGWMTDQNLVPWAAVAAEFPYSETFQGSLFTVLPLPITINQPVLIHGLFSISPDRARLYQLKEDSSQDQTPAKWNEWLLHGPVPIAWTKLLSHLAHLHSRQSTFEWWPRYTDGSLDTLNDALDNVVDIIAKESLPLWSTQGGHVTATNGLLNVGEKSTALRDALQKAKIPVVYVPDRLHHKVKHLFKDQTLNPLRLSRFLISKNKQIREWGLSTKTNILEYILSEPGITEYGSLELFPFEDGKYRAVANHSAFVHRNEFEKVLFGLQVDHNLAFSKLSQGTASILQDGCSNLTLHKSIRHRSANDFRDYCLNFVFSKIPRDGDMVSLDAEATAFVSRAWTWIVEQRVDILGVISDLWLVPMTNGHHRKIKPRHSTSQTIFAPVGQVGDLMRTFDVKYSSNLQPLIDNGPTGLRTLACDRLMTASSTDSNLLIKDGGSIIDFAQWLNRIQTFVNSASDGEKVKVLRAITLNLQPSLPRSGRHAIADAVGALKIFKKVSWKAEDGKMAPTLAWINSKASSLSISLPDGMIAVPAIPNVQFLDAPWSSHSLKLLSELELATCLKTLQVIDKYIIPTWNDPGASKMPYSYKEQLVEVVLSQYSCLSVTSRDRLRALPMVPVARINGEPTSNVKIASELIDPSISQLKDLFFDDEEVVPDGKIYARFHACLSDMGLKDGVDETLISSRIRHYANSNRSVSEVDQYVHKLLAASCRLDYPIPNYKGSELRNLKWLPIRDREGTLQLRSPTQCRGFRDRLLVSSQLLVFGIPVSPEWETRLGWSDVLPKHVLLAQLNHGLQTEDRAIVDAILTYIVEEAQNELFINDLVRLPCILTSSGLWITASKAFRPRPSSLPGCERLHPYLGNVDIKFWQDHQKLMSDMKVGEKPSLDDLLGVQKVLKSQLPLKESDVAVAIEILHFASRFPRSSLDGLEVLSMAGHFCPIQDINYNDLGALTPTEEVNLTHPDVPLMIAKKLGIELLSERLMKGMLEIADIDDEDEFEQQEQITTRITDTLDRYPIDNTFREYLANADDTEGTSKISWLLDGRTHSDAKLLTRELRKFQGPALLVHNDGGNDDDFLGLKNVGEGSKRKNKKTIGQFGRGSQTMYHWTDVPMILSGKHLLILDPQQEVLPKNQIKGKRKLGVKLKLSKLKNLCADQLAPFEGLWGYTRDLDSYSGTIFRFPLRTASAKSNLRVREIDLDASMVRTRLENYFDEARISLLFLRRIRSIDFKVHGKADFEWSISRKDPFGDDPDAFSHWPICSFTKSMALGHQVAGTDTWLVAIEDLKPKTDHLPYSPRRVMKNIECGVAGLVSSKFDTVDPDKPYPEDIKLRMFSTLPLPISSDLPVCIHATFSLSGDRQSLIIDEIGSESHGSKWNRYLLQSALPQLYLSFLDEIGPHVRQDVLRFWPQGDPPPKSCSELLCSSFWEELPTSSGRFFPKAQMDSDFGQRKRFELFNLHQATFDFLNKRHSEILAPLLLALKVNLVRNVPLPIAKRLKKLPEVNSVTGQMLRKLFKSEQSRLHLQEEISRGSRILNHLLYLMIPSETDLGELDGCNVLPLADGTVGTLRLLTPSTPTTNYYFASEDDGKLFDFASGLLAAPNTSDLFEEIIKSEKFNVETLRLCHVRKLLARRTAPTAVSAEADEWLANFWNYWNKNSDGATSSSNIAIDDVPGLFRATCNSTCFYSQHSQLDSLPAVVEPSTAEHQQLCHKFPELWYFDNKFMPKTLRDSESSLSKNTSFVRLIKALKELAVRDGKTLGAFVIKHLDSDNLKVLRNLIIAHACCQINAPRPDPTGFVHFKADLRSIPLWRSFNSATGKWISSDIALVAENRDFMVPWMKQHARFIVPQLAGDLNQNCVQALDIQKVSAASLLNSYLLPLPSMLSSNNWSSYRPLITAVSSFCESRDNWNTVQTTLSQNQIAVDGKRSLCRADELFDHEDQIFLSAFRGQEESKFVHDELKGFRRFWLKAGLRHRQNGLLDPADYLKCLQSLSQRLSKETIDSDANLAADIRIVLSPLTTPSSSTHNFTRSHWPNISRERVFASQSSVDAEPEYRRVPMGVIAADRPLLALSEVISYRYVAICWSQTPFTVHAPTAEVLSFIHGNGKPPVDMVWRHLGHLADMAQHLSQEHTTDFLHDLHCTYTFLQDHTDESRAYFGLRKKAVWLNISSSEGEQAALTDVKSSWNEIGDLVLASSCDAGRVKAVRPSLMRYEKLLRAVGCKSITYPTVTRPVLHHGHSIGASLRTLRAENKLLDITYCTEGKEIQAHRVVLAAVSEKCARQWSGNFPIENKITYDEASDPDSFLSYHTLSTMINYAYECAIDWSEMEASDDDDAETREDKLHMLLDLHKGAQYWLIPALMSQVEDKILVAGKMFINIENVVAIQQRAEYVGTKAVEEMCSQFIHENKDAVERANSSGVE